MLNYLYADNGGTHIFDLVQTAANLNRACYYCMEAAAKGANFIMIGTKDHLVINVLRLLLHHIILVISYHIVSYYIMLYYI